LFVVWSNIWHDEPNGIFWVNLTSGSFLIRACR